MHKQILAKPDSSHDWMDVCHTYSGENGHISSLIFRVRPNVTGAYAELVAAHADSMPQPTRQHEGGTLCESLRKDAVGTYLDWVDDEMFYDHQRMQELEDQFEMIAERSFGY